MRRSNLPPFVLVAALVAALLVGCYPIIGQLTGSGNLVTRTFDFRDFNAIDASSAFQVAVTAGDNYSVSVTADDNVWESVEVRLEGQTLHLGLRQPGLLSRATLRASVTLPTLNSVTVSGASTAALNGFKADNAARGEASGASQITGAWQAGSLDLGLSGASRADLNGSARDLRVQASGASHAELGSYPVDRASVNLSGASTANVSVQSSLDYDLSGASSLTYTGNPALGRTQTSGASSANHR